MQKTPAQRRAEAEEKIRPLGERRITITAELAELDAQLKPLVAEARTVEVSFRRISFLTGASPNTIRAWVAGPAESP